MFRTLLSAATILGMIATPAIAQPAPNPAAKLSLAKADVVTDVRASSRPGRSKLAGASLFAVVGIAGIIIGGIIIATQDDDSPDSP